MIVTKDHDINYSSSDPTLDLVIKRYIGEVVDANDPEFKGRCKVKVFGIYDNLTPADIPWAWPGSKAPFFGKAGGASISIPKKGTIVAVQFDQGDIYSPEYLQIHDLAPDLQEQLKTTGQADSAGNKDYLGSHYIIWDGDEQLKLWFTTKQGLTFENKSSRINVAQNSKITIEHKETQSIIELEGPTINIIANSTVDITAQSEVRLTADQVWLRGDFTRVGASVMTEPAVMGNALLTTLSTMASMIDGKLPASPGLAKGIVNLARHAILSDTVTVGK